MPDEIQSLRDENVALRERLKAFEIDPASLPNLRDPKLDEREYNKQLRDLIGRVSRAGV